MATPRVSIVVPVYNAGRYLAEALSSAAAQTFRDVETVVVDDGSTDPHTRAVLDDAEHRWDVRLLRQPNRGVAAARNEAVAAARGAYVLPLDADDVLGTRFLERTVPVLDAEPAVGVVHTWVELFGGHHGVWRTGPFGVPALLARCTVHVTSLYRRDVWEAVGGYDPAFVEGGEDWDFWLGVAARGWQARGIPEVLARYRRHPGSRELGARAPGSGARVMRRLVAKHRSLYEAHLDDALAALYEHHAATCLTLERIYDHPAARALLRLRDLFRGSPAA